MEYNRNSSLGMLSGKIHFLMKQELQRQLYAQGIQLKVEFYPVMNRLLEQDHVTQQQIADWIGFDRARTSRMIDELEAAGLVVRKDDPESRRTKLICLSQFSRKRKTAIKMCVIKTLEKAYEGFSEQEQQVIVQQLQQIKKNLE